MSSIDFNRANYKVNLETGNIETVYSYSKENVNQTIAHLAQCLESRDFLSSLPSNKIRAIIDLTNRCSAKLEESKRRSGAAAAAEAHNPEQVLERMVATLRECEERANQRHERALPEAFSHLRKYAPADIARAILNKEKEITKWSNEVVRHHAALKGSKSAFEGTKEFKEIDDFLFEVHKMKKRLQETFEGQTKDVKKMVAQLLVPETERAWRYDSNESLTAILQAYPELVDQIFAREAHFNVDPDVLCNNVLKAALLRKARGQLPHLLNALDEPLKRAVFKYLRHAQKLDFTGMKSALDLPTLHFLRTMCPHLKELSLRDCDIGNDLLAEVAQFSELQVLDISQNPRIDDDGMRALARNRDGGETRLVASLRTIHLNKCGRITDDGMVHLCHLQNVENISIRHSLITDRGVATLATLPLREINMGQSPGITDEAIRALTTTTPTLEKVTLSVDGDRGITKTALQLLYNLAVEKKKLHRCVIGVGEASIDERDPYKLPEERNLYVWHPGLENPCLEILKYYPFLETTLTSILSLVPFGQNLLIQLFEKEGELVGQLLRHISFDSLSKPLKDVVIASAHAVKALNLLNIRPDKVNAFIQHFSNIEKLDLTYTYRFGEMPTDSDLQNLNIPSSVQEINLRCWGITAEGLRSLLQKAPNIRRIFLPYLFPIDEKTFQILAQFPKLTELSLIPPMSNMDVQGITRLSHLTTLRLDGGWEKKNLEQVVACLPQLSQLTHLSLAYAEINEHILKALGCCENLKVVDLSASGIDREALNHFPVMRNLQELRIPLDKLSSAELEALRKKLIPTQVVLVPGDNYAGKF